MAQGLLYTVSLNVHCESLAKHAELLSAQGSAKVLTADCTDTCRQKVIVDICERINRCAHCRTC
jgi:hypothetical protein